MREPMMQFQLYITIGHDCQKRYLAAPISLKLPQAFSDAIASAYLDSALRISNEVCVLVIHQIAPVYLHRSPK